MKILNKRVHIRVASGVASGALIFSVIASIVWFYISYHDEVDRSRNQIRQVITTVEQTASIAMYLGNKELAEEVLRGLEANDIISAARLTSQEGLSASFEGSGDLKQTDIAVIFPIKSPFNENEIVGDLLIYPNQQYIEDNAIALAKIQVIVLVLYSIIIAFLTLVIVNRILTEPLKNVANRFHLITPGDSTRIEIPFGHKHNEIGALVGDINHMLDAVNNQIDNERDLRSQTENLSKKFRFIFERASAGIGLIDATDHLIVANPALLRLLGQTFIVDTERFSKTDFTAYFNDPQVIKEFIEEFWAKPGNQFSAVDIQLKHKVRATDRWVHCLFSKVEDINNPDDSLLEVVLYDITERAEREQNIIYEAEHDPITQLLNRRAGMTKLENSTMEAEKKERSFAVLMIDLDGFKHVNDTYGHDAGDKVIIEVAHRIKQFFRGSDVVARWGGDEFLIGFSYNPNYDTAVSDIATDLQFQISQPIQIGHEQTTAVGSSIGISLFPDNDTAVGPLIEQADEAMYYVKNNGKNFFHFYQREKVAAPANK
ncbi:diguanylate cyclase [Enterovibrio norvegicus FF-33]|uniref:Diguanylate cyclase n=1 Tax=Enterovibrio norvegicus FF-454 TaxID=1185651 RepID=A0A1E5C9K9_9GAMM|nr:diguanylate cyclase [Enterovibrio norvegicus]OEE62159.1 diguanylate cyclase [Enterovibrio norvegicus FF-454]OEE65744.1 diguanylate cyclase [Enterovibrio norvegicus FF-33]OEE84076.1 diguanylate cyclase [Enterovibrio norvegicus FF-162]